MPEYITNALKRLLYIPLIPPHYFPHEHAGVNWTNKGKRQYAQQPDNTSFFNKEDTKYVQQVVGGFYIMLELLMSLCSQL